MESPLVALVIGLVAIFYSLALLCAGIVEVVANTVRKRAKYLIRGIRDLVEDTTPAGTWTWRDVKGWREKETALYDSVLAGHEAVDLEKPITMESIMTHSLVTPMRQSTPTGSATRAPSYLPAGVFARVVVDLLTDTSSSTPSMAIIMARVRALDSAHLRSALTALGRTAGNDVDRFLTDVEGWFSAQMDRVTGSYRRWAKRVALLVAAVVVCVGGIDSVAIARALYTDAAVRDTVSAAAPTLCPSGTDPATCAANAQKFLNESSIPVGWSAPDADDGPWGIPLKIIGLLISVLAASLGAPFWYKVLDRLGALRSSGDRPANPPTA